MAALWKSEHPPINLHRGHWPVQCQVHTHQLSPLLKSDLCATTEQERTTELIILLVFLRWDWFHCYISPGVLFFLKSQGWNPRTMHMLASSLPLSTPLIPYVIMYLFVCKGVLVHVAIKGLQVSSTLLPETGSLILWAWRAGQRPSGIQLPLPLQGWGSRA